MLAMLLLSGAVVVFLVVFSAPRRGVEFLSIVGTVVAFAVVGLAMSDGKGLFVPEEGPVTLDVDSQTLTRLAAELQRTRDELAALSRAPAGLELGVRINRLAVAVEDLQTRQQRLEAAIGNDPVRALEVPLLRRDLENLRSSQVQHHEALRADINRIYDMNKWLLGAMALAVVSLGISSLWKSVVERRRAEAVTNTSS
ncbi:MAG TPA: hypothetical protein VFQ45_02135 [Longimicrobium sp.]|nr:hypothetical protein [Longimicrobium sp.]